MARKYGWKKDKSDARDHVLKLCRKPVQLPSCVDLRKEITLPEIYDQGDLGSCTANAIGFAYQYDEISQKNSNCFMPSRLYIYYNEREIEHTVLEDSGAELRDGMKSINRDGVCQEPSWPYVINRFTQKPTKECYDEGKKCKSVSYSHVEQDIISLKTVLNHKLPIIFGFIVYESFESEIVAKTGIMPMPKTQNEPCLGGHAVVCVGYDDDKIMGDGNKGAMIIRNSWGHGWGDQGYFYMPYDFITNPQFASDFWVLNQVTNPRFPLRSEYLTYQRPLPSQPQPQ
uniref:Peptidase C1A papain C-terminal domain-containing protein n=1 Tax=viral metagenome TaxID=1070528 RepID=A0A6C0BK08_9ZZZZ